MVLNPNDNGSYTEWTKGGDGDYNWQCVDEYPDHDESGSYVKKSSTSWKKDLYNLTNTSVNPDRPIYNVTVVGYLGRKGAFVKPGTDSYAKLAIITNGSLFYSSEFTPPHTTFGAVP